MKDKLLVIVGPTAVGKTKISIELAKKLNGEIISGDSMQIYRYMDIGTAKVKPEEMNGIPHHLIDIKEPNEPFSVVEFQEKVKHLIREINQRGKLPIIAGGTGLYIQSVIYNYNFSDATSNQKLRQELEKEADKYGAETLYQRLQTIDPESAKRIHPNNLRRVIRALEVYLETGLTMMEYEKRQQTDDLPYHHIITGLTMDREVLYDRINQRVDQMIRDGLIEEVQALYEKGFKHSQAMQAIGYKEMVEYLEGLKDKEEAIELLKRNSRRYAKRQLTWFKNKMDVHWFDVTKVNQKSLPEKTEEIFYYIAGKLKETEK